jgi:hypothetical protein
MHRSNLLTLLLLASSVASGSSPMLAQAPSHASATSSADTVLHAADLETLLPPAVFFNGQSATVQKRNSGGVRFAGGAVMFATKVDTGGYSSSIQERYQAYLVTEVALTIGSNRLPPGAYGVGFINDSKFVVMDVGGHDLFVADSQRDDALPRPTPLQVLADRAPQSYRLYSGRTFVVFSRASEPGK